MDITVRGAWIGASWETQRFFIRDKDDQTVTIPIDEAEDLIAALQGAIQTLDYLGASSVAQLARIVQDPIVDPELRAPAPIPQETISALERAIATIEQITAELGEAS